MKWIEGYTSRWIKLGGKRGLLRLYLWHNKGGWLFELGPLALHRFENRASSFLLPWQSKVTGSIFWLRFCLGYRGKL